MLKFSQATKIANSIGIEEEGEREGDVWLRLKDGSFLVFRSQYDGPHSDVTPGEGIEPPTANHYKTWKGYTGKDK